MQLEINGAIKDFEWRFNIPNTQEEKSDQEIYIKRRNQ